jgi:phytoene dehydrogenase-like protein
MIEKGTIVVGGGLAGLTAALSLAHKGKDVLLIEKNERCGGLMNSFWRDGFRFEGGARALVIAGLVVPLIKEFGLSLEILPNPITLGIEDKALVIEGEKSLSEYAKLLKRLYPESEAEVDALIGAIRSVIDDMKVLYGVDSPLFAKKKNLLTFAPSVVAWTFKLFRTMYRISRMDTPFEEALDALSTNQALKDIIGQHFFRKTPVFFALSYFALYGDYVYPKGGVGAFIEALAGEIERRGGQIRCETEIVSVDAAAKTIVDAAGQSYRYGNLIWAGDLKALYRAADGAGLPAKARAELASRKQAVLSHSGAESVFSVFAAAELPTEAFKRAGSGHIFYTPDRAGLGKIHTDELKALMSRWDSVTKDELYAWLRRFCRFNTFEVSVPALRDPDAAPPGKTGLIISALFDYGLTERVRASGWYDEFKKKVEEEFIAVITESLYPGLKEKILFSFSASPRSIYEWAGSSDGSIVGWSFEREIPAVTSMFRMADAVLTPLPGVYAAGKWVYSPAGGPTAIMTGRIAAKRCLKG